MTTNEDQFSTEQNCRGTVLVGKIRVKDRVCTIIDKRERKDRNPNRKKKFLLGLKISFLVKDTFYKC